MEKLYLLTPGQKTQILQTLEHLEAVLTCVEHTNYTPIPLSQIVATLTAMKIKEAELFTEVRAALTHRMVFPPMQGGK